jgi:hypothetical protein
MKLINIFINIKKESTRAYAMTKKIEEERRWELCKYLARDLKLTISPFLSQIILRGRCFKLKVQL